MPKCPTRKRLVPKKKVKRKTAGLSKNPTGFNPPKMILEEYEATNTKPVSLAADVEADSVKLEVASQGHPYVVSSPDHMYILPETHVIVMQNKASDGTPVSLQDQCAAPLSVDQNQLFECVTLPSCNIPAVEDKSESSDMVSPLSGCIAAPVGSSGSPYFIYPTTGMGGECIAAKQLDSFENLLCEAKVTLDMSLFKNWTSYIDNGGLHVYLLSRGEEKAIQRRLFFKPDGDVKLSVHCCPVPFEDLYDCVQVPVVVPLTCDTVSGFVQRCIEIVQTVRKYEVCAGQSDTKNKHVWPYIPSTVVDSNPYLESRYSETLRSEKCARLVPVRRWRCKECEQVGVTIRRRAALHAKEEPHPSTPNIYLSGEQKLQKLELQRKKLDGYSKKTSRLGEKIEKLLDTDGVLLSEEMTQYLMDILTKHELTPVQALFLQQRTKAARAKGPSGVRWHPSMIKLALALHMASPSEGETAKDSGMLKLPSQRTLKDYSHVLEAKEGVIESVLQDVSDRIAKMPNDYQRYHSLLCEEIHICQNLVFKKSTGEMIGYVKLDKALADVAALEKCLQAGENASKLELAPKVLTFTLVGVSNDVKEVVASFRGYRSTTEFLYESSWRVINSCERSGIAIVVLVSDGYTLNLSFIKKHKAGGITESGLIYSTMNKAVPDRQLYFMIDVGHLLKTIRNGLNNSRLGSNAIRCLEKGDEQLLWQSFVDLYNLHKSEESYKLTSENVFINSFSGMKVKYAAEVLSRTVAKSLEDLKWRNTTELVKFIRLVNDWFDCLNGAVGIPKNDNLSPYKSEDDSRFDFLLSFLEYLSEWKKEVYSDDAKSGRPPQDDEDRDDGGNPAKKLLSTQTLNGVELTTMAFINLVKFLLREGTQSVNARAFSRDDFD